MQVRIFVLFRETLLDVRSSYATISSEESHIVASGSISKTSQRSQTFDFISNMPNIENFQRNQTSSNTLRPSGTFKPNNFNNNRHGGGSGLVCENCGFNSHTIDRCFKLIGYRADFGKKKVGQTFKGKNVSNNNIVRSEKCVMMGYSIFKRGYRLYSLDRDQFISLRDDLNHINFFDNEYHEIPNDDERVDSSMNGEYRSESYSSHSFVPGKVVNTIDFSSSNNGNDAQTVMILFLQNEQEIIELSKDRKAIGSKWIFKFKYKSNGEIDRCLLDFFVPNSWSIIQLDVNNAFLYGDLDETVYKKVRDGYFLLMIIDQRKPDFSLYTKIDKGVFVALLVYVDNIIITGNNLSEIEIKTFLKTKFMIKDLGKLKYFLGIEVIDIDKGLAGYDHYLKDLHSGDGGEDGVSGVGFAVVVAWLSKDVASAVTGWRRWRGEDGCSDDGDEDGGGSVVGW
nr:ribonuclease H-like domain-containing protein [Tanacetum cinerariifolium]